ncbi:MAG: amino acid adenylation domain-containing protein [Elusimicrobiota bacterium]
MPSDKVPVIPEAPAPVEIALQLPYDFHRIPGMKRRLASHAFALPPAPDGVFAAAFGAQVFRYSSQPSITLNASRISAAGEARWRQPFVLATAMESTCGGLLAQAERFLRRADEAGAGGRAADRRAENSRAAVRFLESGDAARDPALEASEDDLELVLARSGETIQAAFVYDAALFKQSSIRRFADHLGRLSSHIALDRDAPISTLPLLAPAERQWIESVCGGPPRRSDAEFAHRSFEARTAAAPEATAVRYRDRALSYRQLNSRANLLARHLAANGIAAESRVAVCLEPSFDIAVALLAILKAGAVYVPLDPGYPSARIRTTLEDVKPRLVVTRAALAEKISFGEYPVLPIDDLAALTRGLSEENLGLSIHPDQTAYVYYTSGTTGKPKGAAASQANLASYILAARERYRIDESDVMPAIARFTFSISMFELMSPLAAGGTLIILDRDHILDLERLSRTLEEATFFHAGPSLLKNLITHLKRRYSDFGAFSRMRHASSGGDMVPPEVLEGLKLVFFNAEVFVIYGCSEISCMGCTYPVARDLRVERTFVGRPFDNMTVRVLDSALNLLPVGVAGEIYFAGDGIVKGYLNNPELTAERFIALDGRRYYRTGDMGRLSEDGWLEILGRRDFQVKLRGMRIELGEVEHHLRRAAGVRDGVVAAKRLGADENSLVAYVVMNRPAAEQANTGPLLADVHRHMTQNLPDYMVPSKYVVLDNLPLNHNMKVDRNALPEPDASKRGPSAGESFREPRTSTQKRLASLWMKHLNLDRIGLDDHFFDLGGHSVLGITLILEVESELGVRLTGMEVLRESLEEQAALCERRLGRDSSPECPPNAAISPPAAREEFEPFYFGEGRSLYGVLSGRAANEAVLICSSVGHEHFRAHYILRRLAARLAARGVPALRFDYYGCGDSMGEGIDATCGRWRRDIGEAYQELKRRTGAARITAVGVRLGAALVGEAAKELDFSGLVYWDPVCDGSKYFAELTATHEAFARSWRWLFRSPPHAAEGAVDLLGQVYSAANRRELTSLRVDAGRDRIPTRRLGAPHPVCAWNDPAHLNNLLPDVGISAELTVMAAGHS